MQNVEVTNGEGLITTGARRRWVIAIALCGSLVIGAWSNGLVDARSISAALKDPLSLFAARSPGARAPGALTQTKPTRGRGLGMVRGIPQERVLPGGRRQSTPPVENAEVESPGMTVAPVEPIDDGVSIASSFVSGDEVFGGGGGGAPFFVAPTSNGPGIGGTAAPVTGAESLPVPISPVPEPETWLTMMIGLFAIGSALRRKRSIAAKPGRSAVNAPRNDAISAARS